MTKLTNMARTRPMIRRASAIGLVIAAVAACTLVATALAASGSAKKTHHSAGKLAVLTPHLARAAKSALIPAGAVLATVADGAEVYADQNASDEDCIIHVTPNAGGGSVCAPASQVEAEGEVGVGRSGASDAVRVSALVPNGVTNLRFVDRDGSSYTVGVTNNVVEHQDGSVASVGYTLPNGKVHTTNIAAIVDQIPTQPGAPGSSSSAPQ